MSDVAPVAIVTGAGSGIGRAVATLLSQRGYRLGLIGRRAERLNGTGAVLTTPWMAVPANVANPEQLQRALDTISSTFGRVDALINNAGAAPMGPIDRLGLEAIRECFDTNATAPAVAVASVWPFFRRQRSGCIVNVSSMATIDPFPGFIAYAAAKASVNMLAQACAKEGRTIGVRAFAVAPGAVETDMLRANFPATTIPKAKTLTPEAVAAVVVACIVGERDESNGTTILVPSP